MTASAVATPVAQGKQPRSPLSRRLVESVISRSVAVFGLVFGAQTVPTLLDQLDQARPWWAVASITALATSMVFAMIASLVGRGVRTAHITVSAIYLIVLLSWPFEVVDPAAVDAGNHWLYYLLTVATATAAIGLNTLLATAYLFIAPIAYGVIRLSPAGGGASWEQSVLDVVYSVILGGAVVIIVTMLRQAAAAVDAAQLTALSSYGTAVRQHATDLERVQVDAIVHDSVLTTLLSAARAYTAEAQQLAARMAANAIAHLRDAAAVIPDDGSTVRASIVAHRIVDTAATLSSPVEVKASEIGTKAIPVSAAEAVYSAAVQALVNSLQHAGDEVRRWLTILGDTDGGIIVEVGDSGAGFDLETVPPERIGLRVSIIERVGSAGGRATVETSPGEGTVITIRWPAEPQDVSHEQRVESAAIGEGPAS